MSRSLAAVNCPRCPSDSADWAPMWGIDTSTTGQAHKVLKGDLFRCRVCSVRWMAPRDQAPYIPDDDYWDMAGDNPWD